MSRGIGDAFAFQRLLWLLVGTVIVPTVLLTLYGVMAIRNQQAAIEEQVRRDQQERLRFAANVLFEEVEGLDQSVRQAVADCELPCTPRPRGIAVAWGWSDRPHPDLGPVDTSDVGEKTLWTTDAQGALGVFEVNGRFGAWRLDEGVIALLTERVAERGAARFSDIAFTLRRVPVGTATPVEDLMRRWETDRFEAVLGLERPLGGWEVQLTYLEDDPVRAILGPTRWLYPLGLVALVATVMAGTVITLNSAAREIRLSRLQTDFVSSVSHELRTPLTSIRMFVETLQSGRIQDPERVAECLDLLSQETDRLSRMIERVLSWARMESGRRAYEPEPVPVNELVDASLAALQSHSLMVDREQVEVRLVESPAVSVDRDAIVEALLNLLQNAYKYTPAPRNIAIECTKRGKHVGISVIDNGPGIPPADRKKVFEKFYQADSRLSSPTGANRGSGLGLSIVRAVVQAHGGWVDLESELGQGSTFTLWLPAATG